MAPARPIRPQRQQADRRRRNEGKDRAENEAIVVEPVESTNEAIIVGSVESAKAKDQRGIHRQPGHRHVVNESRQPHVLRVDDASHTHGSRRWDWNRWTGVLIDTLALNFSLR